MHQNCAKWGHFAVVKSLNNLAWRFCRRGKAKAPSSPMRPRGVIEICEAENKKAAERLPKSEKPALLPGKYSSTRSIDGQDVFCGQTNFTEARRSPERTAPAAVVRPSAKSLDRDGRCSNQLARDRISNDKFPRLSSLPIPGGTSAAHRIQKE